MSLMRGRNQPILASYQAGDAPGACPKLLSTCGCAVPSAICQKSLKMMSGLAANHLWVLLEPRYTILVLLQ